MTSNNLPVNYLADGIAVLTTITQTNEIFSYVSLALTIISILVSLAFTIYKWWKTAKADGKIDSSEVDDLINELAKSNDELKNTVTKGKDETNND